MATKRVPYPVQRASSDIGKQLALWRRMQNLTAQQVAERADISVTPSGASNTATPV